MRRIRSIKPEWLEDERLALASPEARVLSIGLILLADDYGNGRGNRVILASAVFPAREQQVLDTALDELVECGFVSTYESGGQSYFHLRNWAKHQKVDKPGKPAVPGPGDERPAPEDEPIRDFVYFIQEQPAGNIKIGRSFSPETRLKQLMAGSSKQLVILGAIEGGWREKEIHKQFALLRIRKNSEWFRPDQELLDFVREQSRIVSTVRASRGSSPIPSIPDPGPGPSSTEPPDAQGSRDRFWNLEDALTFPLLERCDIVLRFAIDTHWLEAVQPERWPELTQVASALALADGREQVPRLGRYARDAGTRAIVATLATHPLESVLAALPRVVADPWWQRERPSLSALLPDRITAAQSPPPKQAPRRQGVTPIQPNYGVKIEAEEFQ